MPTPAGKTLVELLLHRLERISVDSYWAHRASGLRGALLETLESMESGSQVDESGLKTLTEAAFRILNSAAREKDRG